MSSQAIKRKLSESDNGDGILIDATTSPGTLIHTAIFGTIDGSYDEIWLWAFNMDTQDRSITIEFGGTSDNQKIIVNIPYQCGLVPILPGLILQNSLTVRIYAASTNVITITGFVHRLSDS